MEGWYSVDIGVPQDQDRFPGFDEPILYLPVGSGEVVCGFLRCGWGESCG